MHEHEHEHQKQVRVGDLEVAYDEVGAGSRVLLVVHGYSGCRHDFEPVLPELAKHGRTLLPDLRGHGDTSHPAEPSSYDFETLLADLVGFLDALGVASCDLLGHSMGGMLALRLALAHPARVDSLILMDTSPHAPGGVDPESFAKAWQLARGAGMQALQKVLQAHLEGLPERAPSERRVAEAWGERYWEHHRRRFHRMDPEAYARLGAAMLEQAPIEAQLAAIRCPTQVMVGEEDVHFRAAAELMAREIPGARLVVIPDAEHHPQRENPAAWLDAVGEHLARVRGGPAS